MSRRIVCVGDCGIDRYVDRAMSRPGGCTLNLAVNLARLSVPDVVVEVVSAVGTDAEGRQVLDVLADERLVSRVQVMTGTTPVQELTTGSAGERRFVGYSPGVLPALQFDEGQRRALAEADYVVAVVFSQIEPLVERLLAVGRQGQLVVDFMDLADFDRSLDRAAWVLEHTDVGFFGLRAEDRALLEGLRELTRTRPMTAVVTLGADGGVVFKDGDELVFEAMPVLTPVDTTGAGDAFAGAFLSRYVGGASLGEAVDFAAKHAAKVVSRLGAF